MYNVEKSVWFNNNIEYLFDSCIVEYDIEDAGFSIIKQYHLLDTDTIQYLENIGKGVDRHIKIGLIQKDNSEFSEALSQKFSLVRDMFINQNMLTDNDIISVKKDAIFTIGKVNNCRFGNVKFRKKNEYSSYIRFVNNKNIEIYYSKHNTSVKGINELNLNKHRLYILNMIQRSMRMIESKDICIRHVMSKFINKYKKGDISNEYYLEFNNESIQINPIFNYNHVIVPLIQIICKEIK